MPSAKAQVTISLPQTNIQARTEYIQSFAAGQYSFTLLSLLPAISARAINTTSFVNTTGVGSVPLQVARLKLERISTLSLLGLSNDVTLSTVDQQLIASLANVNLSAGAVIINLRLVTANQTWTTGIFQTSLALSASGILGGSITPASQNLAIQVPAFISTASSISPTTILINNLNLFRSADGATGSSTIPVSTTVPYIPSIHAELSQFNFSTNLPYTSLPLVPVSTVSTTLNGISNATSVALSTTSQPITGSTGIAVPTNNNQSLNYIFRISAAQLKTSFVQAGTYSVPFIYTWNKLSTAYPTGSLSAQANSNISVVVSDMAELKANQQVVNLAFTTTNDYKNGVRMDMPAHLNLSKTTPYNLYVRASQPNFTSGANSIPVHVLRIGPMENQSGMNTVTLSTTAQQLIQDANPTIDRNLNIRYSIPANETGKLFNKSPGVYSGNIIFSFVAL